MVAAREKLRQLEEQERLNPNSMLVRILVICTKNYFEDKVLQAARARYGVSEVQDWTHFNRLYGIFVNK